MNEQTPPPEPPDSSDAPTEIPGRPPADAPTQVPPPAPPVPAAAVGGTDYPVHLDIDRQEEYARFLPLVKWLLVIPHFFALFFVFIGVLFAGIGAFFAVLFTRNYPEGIFNFIVGALRWSYRVTAYMYLMTDKYPPFSLDDDPNYPVRFNIEYPADGVDRWRPLFAWLLAIPYLVVAGILSYVAMVGVLIGFFAILFTKKFPEGMFSLVLIPLRWQARGGAYAYFQTTRYPPWVWE